VAAKEHAAAVSKKRTVNQASLFKAFAREQGLSIQDLSELSRFLLGGGFALEHQPVGVRQFLESRHFMGVGEVLYPSVLEALEELNSGRYAEAVLTGGIGVAKSTIALYTQAYQLYLLSCYRNPHELFGLDPSSEILIVFQTISRSLAASVEFERFRSMVQSSRYFTEHFPPDPRHKSELKFPKRIIVKAVTGLETGAMGQNVIGGIIDEVNFMSVVDRSRRSADGGTYDQAEALYNSIARRRKSRFFRGGHLPGILCLVSSKRYPGEFTDRKMDEAARQRRDQGDSSIYVYDKAIWEVKPAGTFSEDRFRVFIGDSARRPRVMADRETVASDDAHLIKQIPVDFRPEFERDILNALRDIAGVSTRAIAPFLLNTEAVAQCFVVQAPVMSRGTVDFETERLALYPDRFQQPEEPRFAHVDIGLTGDCAGIAVGFVPRFVDMNRDVSNVERLPFVHIEFVLEVVPPRGGEIQISRLRDVLYRLRDIGVNLRWVSFDGYQSRDSLQILRQSGFITGLQSVDRDTRAYELLKAGLYDGRVALPEHEKLRRELLCLEFDAEKGKVDHPPAGSKDLADAVAGVVAGLCLRREIWVRHRVPCSTAPKWLSAPAGVARLAGVNHASVVGKAERAACN